MLGFTERVAGKTALDMDAASPARFNIQNADHSDMRTTMGGRERMTRMVERRDHDRIPRHDGYWPETIARWQKEGLVGDGTAALRRLQSDVTGICWSWPVPFPGREEVLSEDAETRVVRDSQGKTERHWKNKWGTPEHIAFGCDGRGKWEDQYKPALLATKLSPKIDLLGNAKSFAEGRATGRFCCLQGIEAFEGMRQLVGDEILLPSMLEEPEWVRDMAKTYTDLILRDFQAVHDAGARADAVWVFGDVGYNHGTFFSPKAYRALIWPEHKRMVDWAHAHGMKFIYHTDGDVRAFLDLFVEAGFDCIQPMEAKAGMDVRQLAPKYGRQLSFFGNIDMTVAIRGDQDELENEVCTKLAAGMACRGYAYHSDHSVPPQVSWETYEFLIALLDRHGNY